MNTIVEKDCLTFKDIEKEIFKYVCQIAVDLTKEFLAEYDRKLMQERDTAKYRHKGYKDDHIRCVYGDVPYERVVYETYSEDGVVRQINRCFSLQIKTDILMLNAA